MVSEDQMQHVHTFIVFDLDRTLLNTDALNRLLCSMVDASHDASPEQGDPFEYIRKTNGKNFSVREYLSSRYGEGASLNAHQKVLAMVKNGELGELVYPGVLEGLNMLEDRQQEFGILTYGDEENQRYKLEILQNAHGENSKVLAAIITDEPRKADWIERTWHHVNESGKDYFYIPSMLTYGQAVHARYVIVVDDKAVNIESSHAHVVGYLVQNHDEENREYKIENFFELACSDDFQQYVDAHAEA